MLQDFGKEIIDKHDISVVILTTLEKIPIGIFISYIEDEIVYIGFSRCNYGCGDTFDLRVGVRLAFDKAISLTNSGSTELSLNRNFRKAFEEFILFCKAKYLYLFKNNPIRFNFMSENEYFRKYIELNFEQDFVMKYDNLPSVMLALVKKQYEDVKQFKLLLPNINRA